MFRKTFLVLSFLLFCLPAVATANEVNVVKSMRTTESEVEIELFSTRPFPVRALPTVLRIGTKEFITSRYAEVRNENVLIFTLTSDDFAQTSTGDRITVQYGRGESAGYRWDFGVLNKNLLDK